MLAEVTETTGLSRLDGRGWFHVSLLRRSNDRRQDVIKHGDRGPEMLRRQVRVPKRQACVA